MQETITVHDERFGTLLYNARRRFRPFLRQDTLSDLSGMSVSTIGNLEGHRGLGRSTPKLKSLYDLIDAIVRYGRESADPLDDVTIARLRLAAEELSCAAQPQGNLRLKSTSFVGREGEISELCELLQTHRLVTITGSPGVGKTRLATQAGLSIRSAHQIAVWLVDLAPVREESLFAKTIATTLGLELPTSDDPLDSLVRVLRSKDILLILDNCEHLVEQAASFASAALVRCKLSILATSHERLRIDNERVFKLSSLSLPHDDEIKDVRASAAEHFAAIRLFVERAKAVEPSFQLTDQNVYAIAAICRTLDGLPLAIELAASRIQVLSVVELRQGLEDRFALLSGGNRDEHLRHRTMEATIDWGYDTLEEPEKSVLRGLASFSGGCTLAAAAAIFAPDIPSRSVLQLVTSLAEKSLVDADTGVQPTRYRLLETIRSYGLRKVTAKNERRLLAFRHAQWMADLADRAGEEYWATPLETWLKPLLSEIENMRSATEWALGESGDVILAARIVSGFGGLVWHGAIVEEGRRWIETALARVSDREYPELVARLWIALAALTVAKRSVEAARSALSLLESLGDRLGQVRCYRLIAFGLIHVGREHLPEAFRTIDKAIGLLHELQMERSKLFAASLAVRGGILIFCGRYDEAREALTESTDVYDSLGEELHGTSARFTLAELEFAAGNTHAALALAMAAAEAYSTAGLAREGSLTRANCAAYCLASGDIEGARDSATRALSLAQDAQFPKAICFAIQHLATVAGIRGNIRLAARLCAYVNHWYESEGFEREPTERYTFDILDRLIHQDLQMAEIQSLQRDGARLSAEEAIILAETID